MSDSEEQQIPAEVPEEPKEEAPKKKGRKPRAKKAKAAGDKVSVRNIFGFDTLPWFQLQM